MLHGIPSEELCKTFKDALTVTKALGFNYLWVDSLCIVQDDLEDWRKESALMSKVYGNAILNIAATHAKDGNGGLFAGRDISFLSRQLVYLPSGEVRELLDSGLYERCLDNAPLSQRAWTIQERFLAPRTCHFTTEQVFYECNELLACEAWPRGLPNQNVQDPGFDSERRPKFPRMVNEMSWNRIVRLYSRAKLTLSSDKLVAFSGISHHFRTVTGNEYVAGLSRHSLEQNLCWARHLRFSNPKIGAKRTPYRAPSWSWASIDDPVRWDLYTIDDILDATETQTVINIQSFDILPAGEDTMGGLLDAQLKTTCGPLIRSQIVSELISVHMRYSDAWAMQLHSHKSLPFSITCGLILDREESNLLMKNLRESIFLLPVLTRRLPHNVGFSVYGLVITPALDQGKGYFRRLGLFEFLLEESYESLIDNLSRGTDFLMDESLYQDAQDPGKNGIEQYTIMLV